MTDVVRTNETQPVPGSASAAPTGSSSSLLVSSGSTQMTAGQLSQLHTAKRHREILRDYAQEFRQTKAKITASREREDLLGSVYRDLVNRESTVYGSGSKDHVAISSGSTQSTATRLLLDEQEKYHRSNRLIDNHLSAASTIRSALRAQRVALRNATSGLNSLTSRFPRIKQLVGKIEWRQRKDSIVLGFVIACCIAFLLIYKLS
ncbi:Golgi SNAP receptor complex member 1 [Fasciolopsis buskii]|uniref:Golgi SNAP receptor complex member 1 n=1 Tax=Fasciolopsis buskii TaxID=27845 RepID=A0A8E0VP79_9TREM|nr:Golgi SNAP receptor complex member 1 [Fasciolopsis buski]